MKKNLMKKKNKQKIITFQMKTKKINKINKKLIKVYLQKNNKI